MMTAADFWKSFAEHVLQENSGICVNTKPMDIEATCIISGDRGRSCVRSFYQREQQKVWQWQVNKAM